MQVEKNKLTGKRNSITSVLLRRTTFSFYLLFLIWGVLTLFYYFGELIDFAGWEALRWSFFYTVHDVHRMLFLIPIIYAAYVFGVRASLIITIIVLATFLPRALFISPYPDPLARMLVFTVAAGIMGYLTAYARRESEKYKRIEALLSVERNKLRGILDRMEDGVLVVGPDYRVRYVNPGMVREFGDGLGKYCYEYLRNSSLPCQDTCRLGDVIQGQVARWSYAYPDGRTYQVNVSPYKDVDGVVCQLATFRRLNG